MLAIPIIAGLLILTGIGELLDGQLIGLVGIAIGLAIFFVIWRLMQPIDRSGV